MPDFPFDLSKLDFGSILDAAKKMKEQMEEMERGLARVEIETEVGAGMVNVRANGRGEIVAVTVSPELMSPENKAMLENLVLAGVNQALRQAKERREEEMKKMTGGMGMPGWLA